MSAASLLELPQLRDAGGQNRRSFALDPRTVLLLLVVVNAIVMGNTTMGAALAAGVFVSALVITAAPGRAGAAFVLVLTAMVAVYYGLPMLWQGLIPATIVGAVYWLVRFVISLGMAGYVLVTIRPAALVAALRQLRVPSTLVIPVVVMLRFIPVVLAEARAVTDAMRLRGLEPGGRGLVRRPLATLEMVIVPLLASVSRIADDLTASGLVRGLGSPARPTSRIRLSFGAADGVAVALAACLVAFTWWLGR